MKKWMTPASICLLALLWAFRPADEPAQEPSAYRSPQSVALSPDGRTLAIADVTKGVLYLVRVADQQLSREITGLDRPFDAVWTDAATVAVSEYGSHRIALVDARKGSITARIACTPYPMGLAFTPEGGLLVSGFGRSEVGRVDVAKKAETARIPVWYQPDFISISPDGQEAWVSNLTPKSSQNGAKISRISLKDNRLIQHIELPFGSTNVRQLRHHPHGKWVYVVHTYGKVMLPTSQLERGWVNSNILSILDAEKGEVYASVPFDYTTQGGADPWGLAISPDGRQLYATLAGVNELAILQLDQLHQYLAGTATPPGLASSDAHARIASDVWADIRRDPRQRRQLIDQFAALYAAGLLRRYPLPVQGPRGLALLPDGQQVVASGYFSGDLAWFDLGARQAAAAQSLGSQPPMDLARQGEAIFHDATTTYQQWLSCVSCHPHGRADGLNWDLLNDGIGNPKNAKSLLLSYATPPSMSTGIRANYEVAVRAGFHFIKFNQADAERYAAVQAYLRHMQPDPSPYLEDGALSASALQGKALFESDRAGCYRCHNGPYLTDQQMHDIGTRGQYDRRDAFDTPTLIEAWRTAPYLHDGSIARLEDLFSGQAGTEHWHGKTRGLSETELGHLLAYVRSL